jgi:pilus assembly protein CpaE
MPAFIVADHGSTASRISEILKFGGHDCPSSHVLTLDGATARLGREAAIDLVVVALSPDIERGLGMLPMISRLAPGKVLAVGPAADSKLVLRALRGGADDYVDSAELESELEAAIARLVEAARGPSQSGRLVALLSPNGGSGSSTIAANLAAALAKQHKSAALIDLKLEAGDLSALLDLKPTYTLADLCRNSSKLDRVMFDRSLAKHDSGVGLLAAPHHLDDIALIRPDGVAQALALARACFPFVVVDLDHSYREEQRVVLRQADFVLVPFRLDFASLRNVRRALEHLDGLDIPAERVHLVVNRYGQPLEVPAGKAEEAMGRKIAHYIPEDAKAINRANNHGVPVIIEAPSARVSKSLIQLSMMIDGRRKA